jgi:hypothetical protein
LVLLLGLAHGPTINEDCPDCLLAGGVVRGDVQELAGGARLSVAELYERGTCKWSGEERTDDVCVDEVRERIASLGELVDVVPEGLARFLLATLEVPRVSEAHVLPLEVPDEDLLELRPITDVVGQQEFEPCSKVLPDTDGEVLDDEVVIIHPSGSAASRKSSSHTERFVSLVYLVMLVGGQKRGGNGAF